MSDATQRLRAVAGLLEAIYPGARAAIGPGRGTARRTGSAASADGSWRSFRVLPSRARPRLLVPTDLRGAVRPALQRVSAVDGWRDVAARRGVALLAGSALGDRWPGSTATVGPVDESSVESHLGTVVGGDVRLTVQIGAERANAKPVLGVYRTVDGREIGFCKVGSTALAGRLVRHESLTLERLAAAHLRTLEVPPVLHTGRWGGCDLVLLGTLRGSRGAGQSLPYGAMREVALVAGTTDPVLVDSPWVRSVRARRVAAAAPHSDWLQTVVTALVERHALLRVPHGTWHGDWGPWNMAWAGDRPVVWDWERCADGVPVGMDAAHFVAHPPLRRVGELRVALAVLHDRAEPAVATLLGTLVPEEDRPGVARAVVNAYLIEIACRFAVDAAQVDAPAVERLATWYLQVAAARLDVRLDDSAQFSSGYSRTVP